MSCARGTSVAAFCLSLLTTLAMVGGCPDRKIYVQGYLLTRANGDQIVLSSPHVDSLAIEKLKLTDDDLKPLAVLAPLTQSTSLCILTPSGDCIPNGCKGTCQKLTAISSGLTSGPVPSGTASAVVCFCNESLLPESSGR